MEVLHREKTTTTPEIYFNKEENFFKISGVSIPENAKEFYLPILEWIKNYILFPNNITVFIFELEYFNISSSKYILYIMYHLKELQNSGFKIKIKWLYDNEEDEMFEVGEEYAMMIAIPFEFHIREKSKA